MSFEFMNFIANIIICLIIAFCFIAAVYCFIQAVKTGKDYEKELYYLKKENKELKNKLLCSDKGRSVKKELEK